MKRKELFLTLGQIILIGVFLSPSLLALNITDLDQKEAQTINLIEEKLDYSYMLASWYGPGFHGKKMANGQFFNMYDESTVAHKSLPFGTKLEITNPTNNQVIYAVVKDRGPYIQGREIDLSYAGAQKLGIVDIGVEKLKIRIIE